MLSRRVRELSLSPTLATAELARRLRAEGRDILDLSVGEPDFTSPDPVKRAGCEAIELDRTRYTPTPGIEELRRAIADHTRARRGYACEAEQVLVSPGAKASLYFAFLALLDPGDEVLVPAPYWTSYPEQVRLAGGTPVFVPCDESGGFELTAADIERFASPRTKALILNYPSNPTGVCYDRAGLAPLAEACLRRSIWIVADEIYSELLYDGLCFASVASLDPEVASRTIVIDGVSKTYAMTGWRIGWATGPREMIRAMTRLQSHVTSNATSISQWATVTALGLSQADLAPRRAEFERRRDELLLALNGLPGLSCVRPQGAFYAFPNVSGSFGGAATSGEALARHLIERAGVAVVPGEAFGSAHHLRLSYAVPLERIREAVARMAEALAALA